jgi:hypothetical protein
MNEAKRGWHLLTLVVMTLELHSSLAIALENDTQAVCSATDEGLARQLRAVIDKRYEELAGARALTGNPYGNGITNVVLPYIRPGMSFQDAVAILRCAGFNIIYPDLTLTHRPQA